MDEPAEDAPDAARDDALRAFWADARIRAGFNPSGVYTGPTDQEMLQPPAWAFGADAAEADELLALVLSGRKTATSSALRDLEAAGEELPAPGSLSIILDGDGWPRALVRTTRVRVVPFGEVDVAHARAEGEGDRTLEHWQEVHRRAFTDSGGGVPFTSDLPVVLEDLVVLVPRV